MQVAQRRAHRSLWLVLGIFIPILFVAALILRPDVPIEAEAVERLAPQSTGGGS